MDTTLDGLLNRRVQIEQPRVGFRVAVDTVLLASAVPAQAGQNVLDLGCGVGGAMLCLAARVPELKLTGVDIQSDYVELCRRNIARNAFAKDAEVFQYDVKHLPEKYNRIFDHVIMNPPYHDEKRHDVSDTADKRIANSAQADDLARWIAAAGKSLTASGMLTLIHRADSLDAILEDAENWFPAIEVMPIVPKQGDAPKRIIMRLMKQGEPGIKYCQPLVLHKPEGGYTDEAEAILRHAEALSWRP
jgi:tRNA1(Val) A37 N6-methylase TrmN6